MKKKLLIIGAGNVGGFIAYNCSDFGDYEIVGFLDDDTSKIGNILYGYPVLGAIEDWRKYTATPDLHLVVSISSPAVRASVVEKLTGSSFVYPNFIAPNVWISPHVHLGQGVILYPGVAINYEAVIGDFVIMNMNCAIGHNCAIGSFTSLAPGVNLAGFTKLEKGVDMGIGAATRQSVVIGAFSKVGGQSMIIRNVEPGATVIGVPARSMS